MIQVTRPTAGSTTGRYCVDLAPGLVPRNAIATIERQVNANGDDTVTDVLALATTTPNARCAGAEDASVLVVDLSEGREDEAFYILFN